MLETGNRMAIAGIAFLALAISAVVYVITSVVYTRGVGAAVAAAMAGFVTWLCKGATLLTSRQRSSDSGNTSTNPYASRS